MAENSKSNRNVKFYVKLKHSDYIPFGEGNFKGADITSTIKPIWEGIGKGIESFFANDFCPQCSNIMTYSSHFCKKCNQRIVIPLSFDMEVVNDLIQKVKQIIEENTLKVEVEDGNLDR